MLAPNGSVVRSVGVIASRTAFVRKVVPDRKFYSHEHSLKKLVLIISRTNIEKIYTIINIIVRIENEKV